MTTTNKHAMLNGEALDLAFHSLAIRLEENRADSVELVVCGGSALILTGLVVRTTRDVDGFATVLKQLLGSIGYATVAEKL